MLTISEPLDVVPDIDNRIRLLNLFNEHWQDGRYRNIIKPLKTYSALQIEYFGTKPNERGKIVERILQM